MSSYVNFMAARFDQARGLVEQGWCKDYLALDSRGKPSNQTGNEEVVYNKKTGEEVSRTFYEASKWSLVGALMKASGSDRYPNAVFREMVDVLVPLVKARGFNYLGDFNDYQLMARKKVVKQTTQKDVLDLLDEALALL